MNVMTLLFIVSGGNTSDGVLPSEILLWLEMVINLEDFDGTFNFEVFGGVNCWKVLQM